MDGSEAIDITIVSGCRPDLLERTLASFHDGLFRNFEIGGVYANIDPVFGGESERHQCRAAILDRFPKAVIREPEQASFGAAVKHVWGQTGLGTVFHLEDDWLLSAPVTPEEIAPLLVGDTRAVVLVAQVHGWNGRDIYNFRRKKRRVLGIPVGRYDFNVFSTSPQFIDGEFARRCADLMDPAFDPEKQMRPPGNRALIRYINEYRCRLLPGPDGTDRIIDIGRAWRAERGIEKSVAGGVSTWTGQA